MIKKKREKKHKEWSRKKLKIQKTNHIINQGAMKRKSVPALLVTPVVLLLIDTNIIIEGMDTV